MQTNINTSWERLKLTKDKNGELVNVTNFRRLVGSLRCLIETRPDIVYGVEIVNIFIYSL